MKNLTKNAAILAATFVVGFCVGCVANDNDRNEKELKALKESDEVKAAMKAQMIREAIEEVEKQRAEFRAQVQKN